MTPEERAAVRATLDDARVAAIRAVHRACADAGPADDVARLMAQRLNGTFRDLISALGVD